MLVNPNWQQRDYRREDLTKEDHDFPPKVLGLVSCVEETKHGKNFRLVETTSTMKVDERDERDDGCSERKDEQSDTTENHHRDVLPGVRDFVEVDDQVSDSIDRITRHEDRHELRGDFHVVEKHGNNGRGDDNHNRDFDFKLTLDDAKVIETNSVVDIGMALPLGVEKVLIRRRGTEKLGKFNASSSAVWISDDVVELDVQFL